MIGRLMMSRHDQAGIRQRYKKVKGDAIAASLSVGASALSQEDDRIAMHPSYTGLHAAAFGTSRTQEHAVII